jgi:hypothetical protein
VLFGVIMPLTIDNFEVEQTARLKTLSFNPTILTVANQTTQLDNTTPYTYMLIGSTAGQILKLPNATTILLGHSFRFWNKSSVTVTINDFGGTTQLTLASGENAEFAVRDISTTAGIWAFKSTASSSSQLSVEDNNVLISSSVTTLNFGIGATVTNDESGQVTIDNTGVYYRVVTTETQLLSVMTELNTLGGGAVQFAAQVTLTANRTFNFNNIRWIGATSNDSALKLNGFILNISGASAGNGGAYFQNFRFLGENSAATGYNQKTITTDATNYPLYIYFDNCFFKNICSVDTATYADVSGGQPNGVILDLRNGATSCIFENCDFHSDAISDVSTTVRLAPLTVWVAQNKVTRIAVVGQYSQYIGRNRYRLMPPSGTAASGTYIGFATDGSAIHYGAFPTVTQGVCQQTFIANQDAKQLFNIVNGSTLDLTSPTTNYIGDGLWVTDTTSGVTSFTLPKVFSSGSGFDFTIYKKGSNNCTIYPYSGQTVNGTTSYILSGTNTFLTIYYDNANLNWIIRAYSTDVFGTQEVYAESLAESSTTSTNFQQKLRLTTGNLPSGTYRIEWYYTWSNSSTSYYTKTQIQVNDTTTIMSETVTPRIAGTTSDFPASGYWRGTLSGVDNIDLDYCSSNSGATAYIRNVKLNLWRIS